jgi:hypothetical protein
LYKILINFTSFDGSIDFLVLHLNNEKEEGEKRVYWQMKKMENAIALADLWCGFVN